MFQSAIEGGITDTALEKFLALNGRPTIHRLEKLLDQMSDLQPQLIDCCKNGCRLFKDATTFRCEIYDFERYTDTGSPREQFTYLPVIPRIVSQLRDETMRAQMEYGFNSGQPEAMDETIYRDIHDGCHFQKLRDGGVIERVLGSIPLSVGLDGFSFQKK